MSHVDDLRDAVASANAVVMLGTGFSSAVAEDTATASWIGLLNAGVQYLKTNGLASDAVCDSIESDVYLGSTESGSFLLAAGQKLSDQMQRPTSLHFSSFLDGTVGKLRFDPAKAQLAHAIANLELPVLTTNYDNLYEQGVGKPSTTWQDPRKFRSAALGKSTEVIHLHGIWDDPDTVILTSRDYERIIQDTDTTALRQAIGVLKSIIFVGYGAGLTDPHFERLWEWLAPLLPQGVKHYVLCRDEDVSELNLANMERPIIAVTYGTEYSDLPSFIESLTPVRGNTANTMEDPRTIARVAETCRNQILDQLIATSVMPRVIEDKENDYAVGDLVIEPVLFPVPPDQFYAERAAGNKDLTELDPTNEVMNAGALVIVGEEQAGVSTTLAWAALTRSYSSASTLPVFLDYKQIGQGNHRVQNAIRVYLRRAGAPINRKQPLPGNLVVAIDNVTAANARDLAQTVEDLVKNVNTSLILLGCRPPVEGYIQTQFNYSGSSILLAFLGRLGRHKTIELARRADPDHAEPLADRVLKIAHKEGLTRTPLCLMLLIVGTVNDDAWIKAVSHTTFLDSFIDSLLGRGSFQDDMHLSIDSTGNSMVLQSFAKKLIEDDAASASWVDSLTFIEDVVQSLDWSDRSNDILENLILKGLLVNRGGQVQFRQHVYLHIFAARRCRSDGELLNKLKERPLYYAPVLRHYAALQRDDKSLLQWVVKYAEELTETQPPDDGIYRRLEQEELLKPLSALAAKKLTQDETVDDDQSSPEDKVDPSQGGGEGGDNTDESTGRGEVANQDLDPSDELEYDPYDVAEPVRRTPFPASDLDDAPLEVRLGPQLTLVSNILRDSELVPDAGLKEEALVRALRGWGLLMGFLYDSEQILDLVDSVFKALAAEGKMPEDRADDVKQRFLELWSVVVAASGISEELATRKLARAVNRVLTNAEYAEEFHLLLPAVMFSQHANDGSLSPEAKSLLLANVESAAARAYVEFVVRMQYYLAASGSKLSEELEDFIVEFNLVPYTDAAQRTKLKTLLTHRLRSSKNLSALSENAALESPNDEPAAS